MSTKWNVKDVLWIYMAGVSVKTQTLYVYSTEDGGWGHFALWLAFLLEHWDQSPLIGWTSFSKW